MIGGNKVKHIRHIFMFCLVLYMISAYTTSTSAQQWADREVNKRHTWSITFNEPVNFNTFVQSFKIIDTQHIEADITLKMKDDYTVEITAPVMGYTEGETYMLIIPTTVLSTTGVSLNEQTELAFTIQKEEQQKEPSMPIEEDKQPVVNGLSADEHALATLINNYRLSLGLKVLPISKSLTTVARAHVQDSNTYSPENGVDSRNQQCNLHSWSNNGEWSPVCYTSDHHYASLMWNKPSELTIYTGDGYENSANSSRVITPEVAFNLWKNSPGHEAVMASRGSWAMLTTMGVAIDGSYAHVWFGSEPDPAGYYE